MLFWPAMTMLTHIFRYPVKGLSAEPLSSVSLCAGQGLPFDRGFALARAEGTVDPAGPKWARKMNFLCLMLDEQLAEVRTEFDEATRRLTVWRDGVQVLAASVDQDDGRAALESFFHALVGEGAPGRPRWVAAGDGEFMDSRDRTVSLINLATVRALEAKWGYALDPRRFRGNLYIDGAEPWAEHQWIGATLAIGGARFFVDRRNERCAATNVDPATGQRDRNIPRALMDSFGHADLGLNLHVSEGGRVAAGDAVKVD
jgi:uncharacterized protein YcbX